MNKCQALMPIKHVYAHMKQDPNNAIVLTCGIYGSADLQSLLRADRVVRQVVGGLEELRSSGGGRRMIQSIVG